MAGKRRLMYGVGMNDWHSLIRETGSKTIPEYELWRGVLKRVYCCKTHSKSPSYKGTTIETSWHSMTTFIKNVSTLKGYENALKEKWQLDKDILSNGGKHYSINTCCFIPQEINKLMLDSKVRRGSHPIGVSYRESNKKFMARLGTHDKGRHSLGYYNTPEEAFSAYKNAKEAYVKEVANKWKDQIDVRVYEALMKWEISITD